MPSKKVLTEKQDIVKQLSSELKSAKSIVLADYRGLTVEQDNELRSAFRKADVTYKVVKNTLTRFAAKENGLEELDAHLHGPTAMAYSVSDPVAPAKVMNEYAKKFDKLEIKVGVVEGKMIDQAGVKALADLPSREVLIAKVLCGLNSPITGLVNVLNGNIRGLAVVLNAIKEKKESA